MTLSNKAFKKLIVTDTLAAPPHAALCPHAEECGGCAFQHRAYPAQVAVKTNALRHLWQQLVPDYVPAEVVDTLSVVPSPDPLHYRTRMDYVATKQRFGLRRAGRFNYIVELTTCHLIPPAAFAAAYTVWQASQQWGMPDYNIRTHEGFLRYIVVRRSPTDALLLAAVTSDDASAAPLMPRMAELALAQPGVQGFHWLINATRTDLSFGEPRQHWGAALLPMPVGDVTLHIGPNTFFQNNVHLLLPLLDAVKDAVLDQPTPPQRVADLYAGVGAISLHLAPHVAHVVAVESHGESAALATSNAATNGIANVTSHAEDVLAFIEQQPANAFDTVVVDPPRTGLGEAVCRALRRLQPHRIVYVSCNPLTQADDVQHLAPDYRVVQMRGYDMFPHTPHVEMLAVLTRRGDPAENVV